MTKEVQAMNQTTEVAPAQTIDFPGLEEMPTSFIPVPRIKLVQANSQDVLLHDGQTEARKGSFYYMDTQVAEDRIKAAILAAKPMSHTGPSLDDPERIETKHSIGIIFQDLTFNKVYTLRFQPGSFQNWRNLIGTVMAARDAGDMTAFFGRAVNIGSELVKGDKRSWYVLTFQLGEKLGETDFATAAELYEQFRGYFNATSQAEEEAA